MVARNNTRRTRAKAKQADFNSGMKQDVNVSVKDEVKFENEDNFPPAISNCSQVCSESQCSESDIEQSSAFNKQFYKEPKRRSGASKPDPSVIEPLWQYYPKKVQRMLKKKRVDREKVLMSL